jgi:hypothetical protein
MYGGRSRPQPRAIAVSGFLIKRPRMRSGGFRPAALFAVSSRSLVTAKSSSRVSSWTDARVVGLIEQQQ